VNSIAITEKNKLCNSVVSQVPHMTLGTFEMTVDMQNDLYAIMWPKLASVETVQTALTLHMMYENFTRSTDMWIKQ